MPGHVRPDHPAHLGGPGPLPAAGGAPGAGGLRTVPPARVRVLLQQDARVGPPSAGLPLAGPEGCRHPGLHPQRPEAHHELPLGAGPLQPAAGGGATAGVRAAGAAAVCPAERPPERLRAVRPQGQVVHHLLSTAGANDRPLPVPVHPGERAAGICRSGDKGEQPAAERLEGRALHAAAFPARDFCQHLFHRCII